MISLLGNVAVLIGMARIKHDLSNSVRLYYSIIAFSELVIVSSYFFVGDFLETGISYLVSGGSLHPILTYDATIWSCKLINALWMGPDFLVGLTLVCLGIERIIAVTWPFRAKTILTLRNSVILETTVNLIVDGSFLPFLCIDYTIVPQYGCWYDFSLSFTQFYIFYEESIPLFSSFISFGISIYLIVKMMLLAAQRNRISSIGGISALELSNVATLTLLDVAHLIVYIPDGLFYCMYSLTVVSPGALNSDLSYIIYRLADLCNELTIVPHALTFFILFYRSEAFRNALFGKCLKRSTNRHITIPRAG